MVRIANRSDDMVVARRRQNGRRKGPRPDGTQQSVEKFAGDAYSLARRAVSGLDQIRRLVNIETKVFDLATTVNAINTGTVSYASGISQGTGQGGRVGNSLRLQHITVMGTCAINAAATASTVRVLLIRDMENSGSSPAVADIFEDSTAGVMQHSPVNYTNRKRFSVLLDNFVLLDASNKGIVIREEIPFNKHISYRGTTNAVANAAEGSLFWVHVSNEGTNTPSVFTYLQFTYTDD